MKKWQIFVLLKITEALVFALVPYCVGRMGMWLGLLDWGNGFWGVYSAGWMILLIVAFIGAIIAMNLVLMDDIHKKLKRSKK